MEIRRLEDEKVFRFPGVAYGFVGGSVEMEAGDYEKDGLIYCGKCNTPRQHKLRDGKIVPCICKCRERERDAEDKAFIIQSRRSKCFGENKMAAWDFNTDDKHNSYLTNIAKNYVGNFEDKLYPAGKGLLLYGGVGTGKTYMSVCICNALIDNGFRAIFTNFPKLCDRLSDINIDREEELNKMIKDYTLYVIDDFGIERNTEYMNEIVQMIIDTFYVRNVPIIITTNLSGDELKHPTDMRKERIYSRLFDMCVPVEVKGEDRRKKNLREEYSEYKKMLGI